MEYSDKNTWAYLDGEFVKANSTPVDLFGQSLHYGYSAIEGIRAYNTQNGTSRFQADQPDARLRSSCVRCGIPISGEIGELVEKPNPLLEQDKLRSANKSPMVITGHRMC